MSKEIFQSVPAARVPFSKFDLSHNRKLSCGIGQLVPVLVQECIPGDVWRINSEVFARFAPLISPVNHKFEVFLHGFFVPCRVIWDAAKWSGSDDDNDWAHFISGQTLSLSAYPPNINIGTSPIPVGGLADHLGIPPGTHTEGDHEMINFMPFLAYNMIWSEYYRDENLEDEFHAYDNNSGEWAAILTGGLKLRAWEKDYFTSCWPFAQMGISAAAVITQDMTTPSSVIITSSGNPATGALSATGGVLKTSTTSLTLGNSELSLDIAELRRANKMQIWMETTARAGHRYTEFLKGHFGVWPRDERLQRPEYIGGGRFPMIISDVTSTSGFNAATGTPDATVGQPMPMGTMAGKGIGYGQTNGMFKKCEEHGYIIIIMSVRPEAVYYQGLHRMWSRLDYLDFPFPEFANMGEQQVLNKEIYYKGSDDGTVNNALFGYQSMYADYKFIPNTCHGTFRTTNDFWHAARKFADTPDLNAQFIHIDESQDDIQRIFAVENVEHLYCQVSHNISCDRPLPFFNIPNLE